MSIGTTTRPEVEEPRSDLAGLVAALAAKTDLRPRVRQTTAEIVARVCATLPVAAVTTAATGLATGAFILVRRHHRRERAR